MLENIVKNINLEKFIVQDIDFFSKDIKLFDYQIDALNNTLKFFEEFIDNKNLNRDKLYETYQNNGVETQKLFLDDTEINEDKFSKLLIDDYSDKIDFKYLLNRCNYWMATGSGKTLIMVKLISILDYFIKKGYLEKKNILILAPSDNILTQIKQHIEIFNQYNQKIILKDLKEYDGEGIYIYRADNIVASDTKDKQLNFYDFWDNGNWYLILDEAHKGDKQDSIRQKLFSLIAKNGIMFNFSATFTDEIDKITTIKDFKLDKFLQAGYGKKIALLKDSVATNNINQKDSIVKSLILLSALKKEYESLKGFYSNPLMMVLGNSVNVEKSDLKNYFGNLLEIIKGNFEFEKLKNELIGSLNNYLFGLGNIKTDILLSLNKKDFFSIFHSDKPDKAIEVIKLIDNNDEIMFKLKNSNKPFMLIKASNVAKWDEDFLNGYEIGESIKTSVFKEINSNNDISILMGSRMFIEGWDSNRPNIINFVNLGTSSEAQKLVLQAIGRGVRIEPFKNFRKRICNVNFTQEESNIVNKQISNIITFCEKISLIESLFIFPSDEKQIKTILESLEKVSELKECKKFEIVKNDNLPSLCYPKFEDSDEFNEKPFKISQNDYDRLEIFLSSYDDVTLILKFNLSLKGVKKLRDKNNFKIAGSDSNLDEIDLIHSIDNYFNKKIKKFVGFEIIQDEIKHYKNMCAYMNENDIKEFQKDLEKIILNKKCPENLDKKLSEIKNKILETDEFDEIIKLKQEAKNLQENNIISKFIPNEIECKVLLEHFYIPILYKEESDKFKHIIKVASEIEFINELIKFTSTLNEYYDNWYFSKLDESLDEIYIPYFDTIQGEYRKFCPDFIFWLKKDNKTKIVFIDPKGIEHTKNTKDKIEGFEKFKEELANSNIEVNLWLYNKNSENVDSEKKEYWNNKLKNIFQIY